MLRLAEQISSRVARTAPSDIGTLIVSSTYSRYMDITVKYGLSCLRGRAASLPPYLATARYAYGRAPMSKCAPSIAKLRVCCHARCSIGSHFVPGPGSQSVWTLLVVCIQVFVEEERETELENLFEAGLEAKGAGGEAAPDDALGLRDVALTSRRTIESVTSAERVLEALQVLDAEGERKTEYSTAREAWERRKRAQALHAAATDDGHARSVRAANAEQPPVLVPNLLLLGLDEHEYLVQALTSVRSSEVCNAHGVAIVAHCMRVRWQNQRP